LYKRDYERAEYLFAESAVINRDLGDRQRLSIVFGGLGDITMAQREYAHARVHLQEAIAIFRRLEDTAFVALWISDPGLLALKMNDIQQAKMLLAESLTFELDVQVPRYTAQALEHFAWIAALDGDATRVARPLGAASQLRETIGAPIHALIQVDYDQYVPLAQARLDAAAWEPAWATGRAMSLRTVIAGGLDGPQQPAGESTDSRTIARQPTEKLTAREVDVLRLVVDGHSNHEIASGLSISPYTVANHVASILTKLDVDSRTAAATWSTLNHMRVDQVLRCLPEQPRVVRNN